MADYKVPYGFEYDPDSGLYLMERELPDETGQPVLFRTFFDAETGKYRQECILPGETEADGERPGTLPGGKLWWLLPVAAFAVVIVIVMVCVLASGLGRASHSGGGIEEYGELVVTRDIPSGTVYPSEYEGTLREEGIIR